MAVNSTDIMLRKDNVSANVDVNCAMKLFDPLHIKVFYGLDLMVPAVYTTDYSITLVPPFYNSFTFTPTASLLAKIAALGDGNTVWIARELPLVSSFTETDAAFNQRITDEFDRTLMRIQQIAPIAARGVLVPTGETPVVLPDVETRAGLLFAFDEDGLPIAIEVPQGDAGWSPLLAVATDGNRRVLQIVDWVGGEGAKPGVGYIGATGVVASIANGVDIRGPQGTSGSGMGDMLRANNLSDLTNITTARSNLGLGTAAVVNVADIKVDNDDFAPGGAKWSIANGGTGQGTADTARAALGGARLGGFEAVRTVTGTTDTFSTTDKGKLIDCTNNAGCTVTTPASNTGWVVGDCVFVAWGAGNSTGVTIADGSPGVLQSPDNYVKISKQYCVVELVYMGGTGDWRIVGALKA